MFPLQNSALRSDFFRNLLEWSPDKPSQKCNSFRRLNDLYKLPVPDQLAMKLKNTILRIDEKLPDGNRSVDSERALNSNELFH
jgi:hypothetical protein